MAQTVIPAKAGIQPLIPACTGMTTGALMLEVDHVDLHYGAAIALRQVSLTAEVGAVTCLLGRNGVGKTSLLRAITGAHPVSAGAIRWEGADITRSCDP